MELIRNGSLERLNAILMTAALTSVLPGHVAGNEILQPLAIVVLGGMIASTLITLV